MSSSFDRGLSTGFIDKLRAEGDRGGWWADVLADRELFVGVRHESVDVYWHGQRIFHVTAPARSPVLRVAIHPKYLVDPGLKDLVDLADSELRVEALQDSGFIKRYQSRETLNKIKRSADYYSGLEKTGCHEIATNNQDVIDCEIAFGGESSEQDFESGFLDEAPSLLDDLEGTGGGTRTGHVQPHHRRGASRVDLASIKSNGNDVHLIFWEAKHFSNKKELRAAHGLPPVWDQINRYRVYLIEHRALIEASYKKVAANLLQIKQMGWQRELSPLISEIASRGRRLTLGSEPQIGLLIFGFDQAQKDDPDWKSRLQVLKDKLTPKLVRAVGNVKDLTI